MWVKKKVIMLIAVIFSISLLAACSNNSNEAGTSSSKSSDTDGKGNQEQIELRIVWWGSQTRHDRTMEAIKLFEEKNPTIKISPEFLGWDGYWEKLATQAAGGNLADIIQIDLQYTNEYVTRGLLQDLGPYVDSGVLNLDDLDELYLSGGYVDDKLYQIPLGANSLAVAYDPAMFEEAGVAPLEPGYTWDDYINTARQLTANLDGVTVPGVNGTQAFQHYLRQHDLWLYNEDNSALGYDDDKYFIDFYTMWKDLLDEGVQTPLDVMAQASALEDAPIVHSKAPVHVFNSNQIVALETSAGRPLEMMLYPSLEGGTWGHYLKPTMFFSVTTQSKHPEEAAKFLDFITNDLEANEILAAERGVPVSSKVRDHLYPQLSDTEKKQFDYLDVVAEHSSPIHPLLPPGHSEIDGLQARLYEQIMYGEITPEEAAKQFRKEANAILQK